MLTKKRVRIINRLRELLQEKGAGKRLFVLAALVFLAGVSLWIGASRAIFHSAASFDFQWDVARALLLGENPYGMTVTWSHLDQSLFLGSRIPDPMMANQPPSLLMLLWPFAWLSWPAAKWAWLCANFVFTTL